MYRILRKAATPLPECEPLTVCSVVSLGCDDAREEGMQGEERGVRRGEGQGWRDGKWGDEGEETRDGGKKRDDG